MLINIGLQFRAIYSSVNIGIIMMMHHWLKHWSVGVFLLVVAILAAVFISQNKGGIFVDPEYRFEFDYPVGWLISSDAYNKASHGQAFQLSNFKHATSTPPDARKGQNIVYGTISYTTLQDILDNINNCQGDCNPNLYATSTTVAGYDAVITGYKTNPGASVTEYSISIASPNFPKAVLNIGITGAPENFHVLQDMLQTLRPTDITPIR